MDRGAWQAAVHGITELDMSEKIMMLERSESINISFDTFYMEN